MTYSFAALSYADFEDLSRDLIGSELGIRFEAFAAGPDGGMDGRHAVGPSKTILQSKHYAGTRWSGLKKTLKNERSSIDRLGSDRYILTTSCPLTPDNKAELADIIGPTLKNEDDVFGPGDLNGLLRKHSEVVKSHIKLWLSGTAVLERVLHAALHSFNDITRDEIVQKVRVYAPNPSFNAAQDVLEKQHVLIISGPPGVGKTTLAEMLCYAHLGEGWELKAIRQLDDGLTSIVDKRKQIFYFDDFLGRVALDKSALSKMDSDLARFITRVRKSPNARFILTTRAPIFEEAKQHSEHLADRQLDISRYLLDVGVYSRRIKARILYNHLLVTGTPQRHINALIESGQIARIVDHKNYSPRLIALMTEGVRLVDYAPEDYTQAFLRALDHPAQLWDIPFRKHIPTTCQHLLMALFFCNEFGVQISTLRSAYEAYHRVLSDHYGASQDPKDFEEALKILEGGFIKIVGTSVSFVNPSVRDYLQTYLDDYNLLTLAARASVRSEWAQKVWEHGKRLSTEFTQPMPPERALLARAFLPIASKFPTLPVWIRVKQGPFGESLTATGLSNVERINLVIDWWLASADDNFSTIVHSLANSPVEGWDPWRDGDDLLILVAKLRDGSYFGESPDWGPLADTLEDGAITMIERNSLNSEDLDKLSDAYEAWRRNLSPEIREAIATGIRREFEEIDTTLRDMSSESTVDEHIEILERLAGRADISDELVKQANYKAAERKFEIESESVEAPPSSIRNSDGQASDTFDDTALQTLFAPLWRA